MSNQTVIRLNSQAILSVIESMSPEMKVEFQRHMMKTAIKQGFQEKLPEDGGALIKKEADKIWAKIKSEVKTIQQDFLTKKSQGLWHHTLELNAETKKVLNDYVKKAIDSGVYNDALKIDREKVCDAIDDAVDTLKRQVDARLEEWKPRVDHYILRRMNEVMDTYINKTVEAKFEMFKAQWLAEHSTDQKP